MSTVFFSVQSAAGSTLSVQRWKMLDPPFAKFVLIGLRLPDLFSNDCFFQSPKSVRCRLKTVCKLLAYSEGIETPRLDSRPTVNGYKCKKKLWFIHELTAHHTSKTAKITKRC